MQHFPQKFEDSFKPCVADEHIAVQALWVAHQGPTHLAMEMGDGFDVLLIHGVNTGSINLVCEKRVQEPKAPISKVTVGIRNEPNKVVQHNQ